MPDIDYDIPINPQKWNVLIASDFLQIGNKSLTAAHSEGTNSSIISFESFLL